MGKNIWNYSAMGKLDKDSQNDWNQTLVTMINYLIKDNESLILLKIPKILKPLIKSLNYYKNGKIGEYFVRFYDVDNHIIELPNNIKLEIINYKI
jgi:hypothetical protein